jgi:hypothetical protein
MCWLNWMAILAVKWHWLVLGRVTRLPLNPKKIAWGSIAAIFAYSNTSHFRLPLYTRENGNIVDSSHSLLKVFVTIQHILEIFVKN